MPRYLLLVVSILALSSHGLLTAPRPARLQSRLFFGRKLAEVSIGGGIAGIFILLFNRLTNMDSVSDIQVTCLLSYPIYFY